MLTTQQKGLIYGAFIGDSLALGPHWIYDTDAIKQHFNPLLDFQSPKTPYHPQKKAGDFTHYGDQTLLLLEHLAYYKHLDLPEFKASWLNLMASGTLYLDHASKDSILKLSHQPSIIGSDSQELGGLVRGASLFAMTHTTLDDLISQTHLTHNGLVLNDIAEFTYHLLKQIFTGTKPSESINALYETAPENIKSFIDKAKSLLNLEPIVAIKEVGQSCSAEFGFPASIYLILTFEDQFEEALIQNAYAGGDSAARGMYVGMILGAYHGFDSLPSRWVNGLNHKKRIEDALRAF